MGKKCFLVALVFSLLGVMPVFAVLATDYELTSGSKATVYDLGDGTLSEKISAKDLISGVRATQVSGGFHGATVPGTDPERLDTLTDGTFAPNGLTVICSDSAEFLPGFGALVVEYPLSPAADISEILVFAGHDGDGSRAWINVMVEVDTGSGYTTLVTNATTGPYGQSAPGQTMVSVVRIYDDGGGDIATNVQKVKITFYDVSHNSTGTFKAYNDNGPPENNYPNQGAVLKEIDIFGNSVEPGNWTYGSYTEGWNSPSTTWNTNIYWTGAEGHDAAGAIQCTDADAYCGVRNTVTMDGSQPFYGLTAWVKLVDVENAYGLSLSTWMLDASGSTADPYASPTLNVWQRRTRKGTAHATGYTGGPFVNEGFIMINSGAGAAALGTYDWYVDDVIYKEYTHHPAVVADWTFDADIEGWNSPGGTWNTTIAWTGAEGHDATGAIQCTDSDIWCGARNTVAVDGLNTSYTLTGWVKLVSVDSHYGMGLNTWYLDDGFIDGTVDAYSTGILNVWQQRTRQGIEDEAGWTGNGYIMIQSTAPWAATDPATYDWYIDDVSYRRHIWTGVRDWSLY